MLKIQKTTEPQEDDNKTYEWSEALTYCNDLTLGGSSDWRLLHIKELSTLVYAEKYNPAINATYFPNTSSSIFGRLRRMPLARRTLGAWTSASTTAASTAAIRRVTAMSGVFEAEHK